MSKEYYQTTLNVHISEFGCVINKGSVIIAEDGKIYAGALEGEISNPFRIFVRNGFLKKIEESEALKILESENEIVPKHKETPKMEVVNADVNKIDIPDNRSDDQKIIDQDNGVKVNGMKVEVRETINIGQKVKDIPTESKDVKASEGDKPRNTVHESKTVDKDEIQKRREERVKAAEEAEKANAAKAEQKPATTTTKLATTTSTAKPATTTTAPKTSTTTTKPASATTAKPAATTAAKSTTTSTAKPATTATKPTTTTVKTETKAEVKSESKEIAKEEATIPIKPSENTSVKSGKASSEFGEVAETIKIK